MDQFDSLATPMLSTSLPEDFVPIDNDTTPFIVNGRISEPTGLDFLSASITYDDLANSKGPIPILNILNDDCLPLWALQGSRPESTPVLNTRLWKNQLYVKRVTRMDKFKQLHRDVFPELSQKQMVFVYFNYFTTKSTHYDETSEFEKWDASDKIKEIVQTRLAQQILSDH